MNIPLVDLSYQNDLIRSDIDQMWDEVVTSSAFIGGSHVATFERQFAEYLGSQHAVGLANGTDALHLALRACGIGPGDEVITAANTFIATTEAISAAGATVVLADIDPRSYTIDPEHVEALITGRTRAIIPVHLYGQPADMMAIMDIAERHQLRVIEDASQAHGALYGDARVGTIGDIGCFSCYPGKNLGAFGDAGVAVTDDDQLADRIRLLANHGSRKKYHHEIEGWNSRLDTIQAAVLNAKLPHLDAWNDERRAIAAEYSELLKGASVGIPAIVNGDHVWHLYVIEVERRDKVMAMMAEQGISTSIHYPIPLHRLPAYQGLGSGLGAFPATERAASRILSLPMYPGLTEQECQRVVSAVIQTTIELSVSEPAAD